MCQPDIVRSEVASMRLEPWVVVSGRRPVGTRRPVIEVPTTPAAVAVTQGHFAAHVEDLAVLGELPEDPANAEILKLLDG